MSGRLAGRNAIVTGAASGIGAATVKRLQADGASVLAVDLNEAGLAGDMNVTANLADPDGIATVAAMARANWPQVDILVNNAGVCTIGVLEDLTDAAWQTGLDVNVLAPARLTVACLPLLRKSAAGRIVNTGSILSSYGDAGLGAYAATKHAILGLTKSMAMEYGPEGITANCVQPGCIVTGMTREMLETPENHAYYRDKSALKRLGQPEDIADVIAFLASDDARFVTGQGIMVDGGVMVHS